MTRMSKFLLVTLGALILSGCASLDVNRMVPEISSAPANRFDKTIAVRKVTGAQEETFGGPAMVSDEQFKQALVQALDQSGLFRGVITEGSADLEISAEFVAQGQGAGLNFMSALVVEYLIVDSASQDEVWSDAYNSRHEVKVSEALSGAKRTVWAAEGSVRKNIAQLLEGLTEADLD